MVGDVLLNLFLCTGIAYAVFRSFKSYKALGKVLDGVAVPVDASNGDIIEMVTWLQFWVIFSIIRALETFISQRFEAAQFFLVASTFLASPSTRKVIQSVYCRLAVPALHFLDTALLPQFFSFSKVLLSQAFKFFRTFHTNIVKMSLRTLTDGELERVEQVLK